MARDYKREYEQYHSKPDQKKRRAGRNRARRIMTMLKRVKKGDGKDVHHKDGNPRNNKRSNLTATAKSKNRSFPRNRTAGKK